MIFERPSGLATHYQNKIKKENSVKFDSRQLLSLFILIMQIQDTRVKMLRGISIFLMFKDEQFVKMQGMNGSSFVRYVYDIYFFTFNFTLLKSQLALDKQFKRRRVKLDKFQSLLSQYQNYTAYPNTREGDCKIEDF